MLNIVQPQVQAWTGPKALRSAPKGLGRALLRQPKVCRVGRRSRIVVGPPHSSARQGPLTVNRLTAHIVHTQPTIKEQDTPCDTLHLMTTLVGVQGKDFVVMAADSQITDNDQRIISVQTPKIVTVGKYLLGVTGDSRPGDILAYNWTPPTYKSTYHPVEFMGKKVIPSIYTAFKDNGYEIDPKEGNFAYLLSFNAYLFSIGGDLSFNASEMGLFAAGSGGNYALGYLYSLEVKSYNKLLMAKVVAEKAVKIASVLDINTCPPIQLEVQTRG